MFEELRGARSRALAVVLGAAMAFGVAACGGDDETEAGTGSGGSTESASAETTGGTEAVDLKGKKVALVTCEPNVWCHAYNVNLTNKLEAAGAEVTQLSDNFDPALQNRHMNQAIAQRPDVIVLFASNADAVVPALRRAQQAEIPVVNVNARLEEEGDKLIAFEVIADNSALGKAAAENMVEGLEKAGYEEGKVILVTGTAGTNIVQDRIDAFMEHMKDFPQYEVVATEDGNWDQVQSAQVATQLLTKYRSQGGIQGAYGMADYQAAGIIQAAEQLGMQTGVDNGDLVVTGSNCTPTGMPLMEQGKLWGNATQSPIEESNTAFKAISAFLNGEEQEHTIVVEEERFTMDNFQDYMDLCSDWPE